MYAYAMCTIPIEYCIHVYKSALRKSVLKEWIVSIEAAHYDALAAVTPQIVLQEYRHVGAIGNLPEEEEIEKEQEEEHSAVLVATLYTLIDEGYII